jgi:cell division protein FtsI/penicillin-binding protein 2
MRYREHSLDKRLAIVTAMGLLWVVAIGAKLIRLQVKEHDWLQEKAERQQQMTIELSPMRGIIYDRNGLAMARSVEVKSLYACPAQISNPEELADKLSRILRMDSDLIFRRVTSSLAMSVIKRKLSDTELSAVQRLGAGGLHYLSEMKRFYVNGPVASQVLGFVDVDERGQGGVELSYEKLLRGQPGRVLENIDALKRVYDHEGQDPTAGGNITLTIDPIIQGIAERGLSAAVHRCGAHGGTILITRPSTGEVLAMASQPDFNPNDISDSSEMGRRNRAVETAFEPGSIFKIVTYSGALEEGIITPKTTIDVGAGEIRVADHIVHDENRGKLTAAQALARSSNVAAIKIGEQMGKQTLAHYIDLFGFGRRTGIELPGESRGLFREANQWDPSTIGSIPMGYQIGVTAIQAVAAFGCIANGGEWVKPYLVSRTTSAEGELVEEHKPETRRVISARTAATLKEMLEGVVIHGTGKLAKLGAYSAAGKTGTAHKVDERTGRYARDRYVASFAGFAPVENPQIACIVSIDEPRGKYYGGDVAAPAFAQVSLEVLKALGVEPADEPQTGLLASDLRSYETPQLLVESEGNESEQAAADGNRGTLPSASNLEGARSEDAIRVPLLIGKGVREATEMCATRGLNIVAAGDGLVARQVPAPGALVQPGTACQVTLSRNSEGKVRSAAVPLGWAPPPVTGSN